MILYHQVAHEQPGDYSICGIRDEFYTNSLEKIHVYYRYYVINQGIKNE